MEFLRPSRRRTLLSEAVYILLNVGLALAVLITIIVINSPYPALALILLSKWRVLAVRPQHWFAHIISNTVDIIVGVSFAIFVYLASGSLFIQLLLTALYVAWLLVLKPGSKRSYVVAQASVGLFMGVMALAQVSHDWWSSAVVVVMWIIGYTTARHALGAYDEPHTHILSLVWGFVLAELGWLTYHWTFGYALSFTGNLQIPQVAIIAILLSFLAERTYASYHKHDKQVQFGDILLPLLLTVSVIGVLLTTFNSIRMI